MNDEPCKREHLRAIIPSFAYWTVDTEGCPVEQVTEAEDGEIDEYYCGNCSEQFVVEADHLDWAWQAALDHLPTARTSDGRFVKVEVEEAA